MQVFHSLLVIDDDLADKPGMHAQQSGLRFLISNRIKTDHDALAGFIVHGHHCNFEGFIL